MRSFFLRFRDKKVVVRYPEDVVFKRTSDGYVDDDLLHRWYKMCVQDTWFHVNIGCKIIPKTTNFLEQLEMDVANVKRASTPDKVFSEILMIDDFPYFTCDYEGDDNPTLFMDRMITDEIRFSVSMSRVEDGVDIDELKEKVYFLVKNAYIK